MQMQEEVAPSVGFLRAFHPRITRQAFSFFLIFFPPSIFLRFLAPSFFLPFTFPLLSRFVGIFYSVRETRRAKKEIKLLFLLSGPATKFTGLENVCDFVKTSPLTINQSVVRHRLRPLSFISDAYTWC